MILYVRSRPCWINFIHNIDELKDFEDSYIPGRKLLVGDLSVFTKPMLQRMLKFVEENSSIDCYTSKDLTDPILLSRFVNIVKEPSTVSRIHSTEEFNNSDRDYLSAYSLLSGYSSDASLRAPLIPSNFLNLLDSI